MSAAPRGELAMKPWHTGLVLLALAVAWSWPAAIAGDTWLVGRHFDLQGTVWIIDAAPRVLSGHDPMSAWPMGAEYARPDSWTLLLLSSALGFLSPVLLHNLLQVTGLWLSAWAAEAFARALGAKPPWSLLAGLGYAFGGLASTTLLEGHVYQLMDPWLPLMGLFWWRATGPRGRWWEGALAGSFWTLSLLTTAYHGIAATLLVAGVGLGALLRRDFRWQPLAAAAAVAALAGGLYVASFASGEMHADSPFLEHGFFTRHQVLQHGSADLVSLAAPTPELDRNCHSSSSHLPAFLLALTLVAPAVLRRDQRWRALGFTGLGVFLLTLGPSLSTSRHRIFALPMHLVAELDASELMRFPARLGWTFTLCAGVLAALVATALARRSRWTWALLPIALVDLFVWDGMPARQRTQLAAAPSAYAGEGPVLDFFPEYLGPVDDMNLWFQSLACAHQVQHQRPIADDCVAPYGALNPRLRVQQELQRRIFENLSVASFLGELGFTTVVFHADLFPPGDRQRLQERLEQLDPEPVESWDGGEHLLAFRVPARAGDPREAFLRLPETR